MQTLKNVLLIHTDGNTFNNPTLKCVVDLLLEKKVSITIRYPKTIAPMPESTGLTLLPFSILYRKIKNFVFNLVCWNWLSRILVWFEYIFIYKNYDLIISVDRRGLIEAYHLHKITNTPFVFFSFEIMFSCETSPHYKAAEILASKYVKHWFVQDDLRAKHLEIENRLNPATKTLIPLASSGQPSLATQRLRDKLGIPLEKKVAITIGSISNWSMTPDIISTIESWPNDWVLILHHRYGRTEVELENLGCELSNILNKKIYISNLASDLVDDMSDVLAGVSVGLAFYKPIYTSPYTGNNLKYLGISSGKISTYLRHGVPIILNEIGAYSDLAKTYGFGIVINDLKNISENLDNLNHPMKSQQAKNFYLEHLNFEIYLDTIWNDLQKAANITG